MTPQERGERAEHLGLLARRAQDGDRAALEGLLAGVRDDVYRLALRMTGRPADAEDATQEVLVKVLTRLGGWRGEARVTTWVHRVTVNHLLDRRRSAMEQVPMSFDEFGRDLLDGLAAPNSADPVQEVLLTEVRLGCTMAMLLCLDREHRIAYILGELLDVPGEDAAWICEVSHDVHRKRLSRSRSRVREFMSAHCGLVDATAPCGCSRRAGTAVRLGRVSPTRPALAGHPVSDVGELRRLADAADALTAEAAVMRAHPDYAAPEALADGLRALLDRSDLVRAVVRTPPPT